MDGNDQFNVATVSGTIVKGKTAGGTRRIARKHRAHVGIVQTTGQGCVVGIKGHSARHFNEGTFADIFVGVEAVQLCERGE